MVPDCDLHANIMSNTAFAIQYGISIVDAYFISQCSQSKTITLDKLMVYETRVCVWINEREGLDLNILLFEVYQ